ncbi:DNA-directed DNA polymerase [Alistipes communis]|jgi:DNA polymerase-3 subunit alpha|uniref:DNA polymerase III subunit alpha n=10 Tax=Alistipes communis TaxID=2585118 RepID=A0A4Y1WVD4_9BACT|nr:DNA polymerase III subunit alpha [Alistipes communis]BBL05053.1 DNA-directed DNA polymerase [Alistipes communis]
MTTPPDFVHLHVHSQYSILDGQASIQKLVDKAMRDGQPGIALTDHGNMFGIKEFYNYVKKVKGKYKAQAAEAEARLAALVDGSQAPADPAEIARCRAELADLKRKAAFKPIIGSEVYVARRRMQDKEGKPDQSGYHLILLAKNLKGYHNLIKIVSKAWTEGFYMRPRTDRVELEKYHEGLICCSACLAGEVPRAITADDMQKAEEAILWHKKLFGDDYYLELQLHKATVERANHEAYPMQLKVNEHLRRLAAKHGVRLVCTNDVHFVDEDNAEAHDRLICLSTGKDLDDPKRMLYSKQEWLKTREEMAAIFGDVPEAMATTVEICEQVETYSIDHSPIMPTFEIPAEFGTEEGYRQRFSEKDLFDEFTQDENGNVVLSEEEARKKIEKLGGYDKLYRIKLEADYLRKLTMDGARKRYGEQLTDEQQERLNFELHIMKTMGFPGYFLIVQDFIRAAREELDVSVGPGRGSAAGSAVAYCLGITQIDPIAYDLLFERFLNPDRISLPDIDVDFDDDGRGRVLNWVTQKYGKEKVAHIITYGTMATKMAIKDVARVQKLLLAESDRLCKLVPDKIPDKKLNLPNAIEYVPELKAAAESDNPVLRDTMRYAQMLEGNVRGTGVHACGTIICRDDITDWVPVSTADDKETGQKMLVTQYEGSVIEDTGLIKMDFLGLKTLSIIKDAVENIRLTTGRKIDIDDFSIIDDPATYKLFCEGRTVGTFQFESPGMQKYLRELQPSTFEDLIAMNALYRPGPMDYIPDFIARKHGRSPIVYDIPVMEKYLKDTYGVTVYQEQVMLLSRLLANFTRGESDTLRKAMGKKLKDKLDALKPKFIKGGQANGHDPKVLEKIWGDWEKFASYAFNKSHATCYSWVAFQTAYLKANYPSEYMAAVLSRNLTNVEQLTIYMNECKRMGINVLGPDINESMLQFSANKQGDVRFGLAAIKGVGEAAVESIIAERTKNGRFKDIYDFIERVDYSLVNRKCLENIAYAGGYDSISGFSRCKFFGVDQRDNNGVTYIEQLMRYGQRYQSEKNNAQQSLFGGDTGTTDITPPVIPACAEWSQLEKLNKEREVIGLYLSAHPLDDYKVIIRNMCKTQVGDLDHLDELKGKEIAVAGMVVAVQNLTTKTGKPWGKFKLEDYNGTHEFALFGKDYENFRKYLFSDYFLFIRGRVQPRPYNDQELEFRITSMMQLSELQEAVKEVHVQLAVEEITRDLIARMGRSVKEAKGNTLLRLNVYDRQAQVSLNLFSKSYKVSLTQELVSFFEDNDIKYTVI